MDEVGGALIAIALVLASVFVPAAFISGISGQFYRQFALTIATATVLSLIVSLTLSPAMAALLLKAKKPESERNTGPRWRRTLAGFGDRFNHGFDKLAGRYSSVTKRLIKVAVIVLVVYAGLIAITPGASRRRPGASSRPRTRATSSCRRSCRRGRPSRGPTA